MLLATNFMNWLRSRKFGLMAESKNVRYEFLGA
jgi:hypothetical protein